MPLGLLIPLLSPLFTEAAKWAASRLVGKIPPQFVPLVSAAAGGLCVVAGQATGIDLGVDAATGAALGLSGTGVHQVKKLIKHEDV